MHAVAQAFARLGESRGVVPRYSSPVRRIVLEGGRATGVELASGEHLPADRREQALVFGRTKHGSEKLMKLLAT